MSHPVGRKVALSPSRRLIADLMHFSRKLPAIPMERTMDLRPVVAARQGLAVKPSWCAIFTKAYGLVASRRPELRRAFVPLPWSHLYEHPINVATVAVERHLGGEEVVLFAHLRSPEQQDFSSLESNLRRCKEDPIETIGCFRRALRISRWPTPVRRFLWWSGLDTSGYRRARHLGTFGVSVTAGHGAAALKLISPLTTTLHYGLFDGEGRIPVRLTFDHRVLDGAFVARVLCELENALLDEILSELLDLRCHEEQALPAAPSRIGSAIG